MLGRVFMGGLGWAFAGPIGGLIGWWLGGQLSQENGEGGFGVGTQPTQSRSSTRSGDFAIAVLVLMAKVLKADGRVVKSEIEYVKQYFLQNFGVDDAQEMMRLLKNLLEQDYYIYEVATQINRHMQMAEKLQLLHVLFGISAADGQVHASELDALQEIARHLKISTGDFDAIKAQFVKDTSQAYQILEADPQAGDDEIKKAYRRMAARFHPDKVSHLGPEFQKMAEEKFKAINQAYQEIRTQRGF
ncbi:MAG: molecular chaperone DjiA [Lentisphaeria bacterium]|nr:molecular chaperone DjiA [Candidatus Neomarinimicrobiota bacterium]MCF7841425.1 molecular chaperone DjiA [Lentisphaeria bacterium]